MTEEQKLAEKELEKTLNTLSEEELNMLSGGKVTDDVKKFFRTDKGKEVLKWTGIIGGSAAGVTVAAVIIGSLIKHKSVDGAEDIEISNPTDFRQLKPHHSETVPVVEANNLL